MDLPELALLVACHLAIVRSDVGAVQLLSGDHFGGRPFLVRSSLRTLHDTEAGYDGLLRRIRAHSAAARDQSPQEVRPTTESVRELADCWLHEARQEVLQRLEPDADRDWQDFVGACRGRTAVAIEF